MILRQLFKRQISISQNCLHTRKTHYEVLNLKHDCTLKQIREAYIKKSKELHPDRNKSKNTSADFIKVTEAYKVLADSVKRRQYDLNLTQPQRSRTVYETYGFEKPNPNEVRDSDSYYGIKGVSKVSNLWIVVFCLVFTSIGVAFQVLAIRHSFTFNQRKLDERSAINESILSSVRQRAKDLGTDAQLQILKEKADREQEQMFAIKSELDGLSKQQKK